ncbi:MAG: M48 family metallopeptidase [Sneathiella sp.]|nr:M48 family metallopeptidase [Sneathiella sp.]
MNLLKFKNRPKPVPPLLIEGEEVSFRIKHVANAKRMKLRISASREVVLVLPKSVSVKKGLVFLEQEKPWITEQISKIQSPIAFENGAIIPLQGENYQICHVPDRRGLVWVEGGKLLVAGKTEHVPRRVYDWILREGKSVISEKALTFAEEIQVEVKKIALKDQKSRWGSCSPRGNLNFSWRLLLMPETILDYVVAHEVAHLRHMNHSADFWALVQKMHPEMETSKSWLKQNGVLFHKYGATY